MPGDASDCWDGQPIPASSARRGQGILSVVRAGVRDAEQPDIERRVTHGPCFYRRDRHVSADLVEKMPRDVDLG